MKLSKAAEAVLSVCWENDQPRNTNFVIDNTYNVNGETIKTTEDTYEELVNYQPESSKPYKVERFGNTVNVMGGRLN
ncbi:hypothetical protein D3C73_185140 [compost metagenome]